MAPVRVLCRPIRAGQATLASWRYFVLRSAAGARRRAVESMLGGGRLGLRLRLPPTDGARTRSGAQDRCGAVDGGKAAASGRQLALGRGPERVCVRERLRQGVRVQAWRYVTGPVSPGTLILCARDIKG